MNKKLKILIIDEDTEFANELKECLVSGGYHLLPTKDNVKDGIDVINEHLPDGVVLDIQLKGGLGLDVLNYLKPELKPELNPVLIVVSSYINDRIIAFLKQKKCLYFDKNYKYKHELVLNYFNDMIMIDIQQQELTVVDHKTNTTMFPVNKVQHTDKKTKYLIHKKLTAMGFNSKVIAYQYLVDAIQYVLSPDEPQINSLTGIFKRVTYIQYSSAFNGVKRLITTTFYQNPNLFCNIYYGISSNTDIEQSIPSVKEFIYHIVDEINNSF